METFSWLDYTMISAWQYSEEKARTIVGPESGADYHIPHTDSA